MLKLNPAKEDVLTPVSERAAHALEEKRRMTVYSIFLQHSPALAGSLPTSQYFLRQSFVELLKGVPYDKAAEYRLVRRLQYYLFSRKMATLIKSVGLDYIDCFNKALSASDDMATQATLLSVQINFFFAQPHGKALPEEIKYRLTQFIRYAPHHMPIILFPNLKSIELNKLNVLDVVTLDKVLPYFKFVHSPSLSQPVGVAERAYSSMRGACSAFFGYSSAARAFNFDLEGYPVLEETQQQQLLEFLFHLNQANVRVWTDYDSKLKLPAKLLAAIYPHLAPHLKSKVDLFLKKLFTDSPNGVELVHLYCYAYLSLDQQRHVVATIKSNLVRTKPLKIEQQYYVILLVLKCFDKLDESAKKDIEETILNVLASKARELFRIQEYLIKNLPYCYPYIAKENKVKFDQSLLNLTEYYATIDSHDQFFNHLGIRISLFITLCRIYPPAAYPVFYKSQCSHFKNLIIDFLNSGNSLFRAKIPDLLLIFFPYFDCDDKQAVIKQVVDSLDNCIESLTCDILRDVARVYSFLGEAGKALFNAKLITLLQSPKIKVQTQAVKISIICLQNPTDDVRAQLFLAVYNKFNENSLIYLNSVDPLLQHLTEKERSLLLDALIAAINSQLMRATNVSIFIRGDILAGIATIYQQLTELEQEKLQPIISDNLAKENQPKGITNRIYKLKLALLLKPHINQGSELLFHGINVFDPDVYACSMPDCEAANSGSLAAVTDVQEDASQITVDAESYAAEATTVPTVFLQELQHGNGDGEKNREDEILEKEEMRRRCVAAAEQRRVSELSLSTPNISAGGLRKRR